MKGIVKNTNEAQLFYNKLSRALNPKHSLYKLAGKIPWNEFEETFSKHYSKRYGRPSKPIRLMVSLLLLKQLYNVSDEQVVMQWTENPYWQYFSGMQEFQWELPCDPTELVKFRNRIGEKGAEKIFEVTVKMHGKESEEREIIADTTVQEKNITYPTDTKLHLQIIEWVWRISDREQIRLRQTYKRTIPKLKFKTRYYRTLKRKKEGKAAIRKIKTIAGRLIRDIERKMSQEQLLKYSQMIQKCYRILNQRRTDKNKLYSLYEEVSCIAKGKEHKKYEFGSKVSILLTKTTGIIVGAKNFRGNPYDGKTLEPALEQYKKILKQEAQRVLVDGGYRGKGQIGETEIMRVHGKRKKGWSKWRWKQRFKRRASIEPVIGHLKQDHRLGRNYLKGEIGDSVNLLLSCAAFNLRKLINSPSFIFARFKLALKLIFNQYILILFSFDFE
ncbi:MAG: IS5 family transposase [Chlorobi bacterium]|nr:IS5 family transposase [Chlorobiota bacterium]